METEEKLRDYLRRATADLRTARRRIAEVEERAGEPIAIVGMACRFPGGVHGPEDLWSVLDEGRDLVGPFPTDRGWDLDALWDPTGARPGSSYVREGGFLDEVALFDAEFFGISPREALSMDPQHRLLLETVWEGLERARIDPQGLRGSRAGVYLGATDHDYRRGLVETPPELEGTAIIGRSGAVSSGRIAYTLGLHGPALTIDTMCSSSLVALHLAMQGLRRGDCSLAIAGGTTVMSTPEGFVEFSRQQALASDGRCKAFADAADGTGWAEGVGALVVERLSDARRLGHPVLAVVRGSAINQDGASNGLTAPNGTAQRALIEAALADARVPADEVDMVEAHGTGTTLGDPIEAGAVLATYGRRRPADRPLWLGSLKSNLGHASAAAGVGGVIKTVLAMQQATMPRTLHVDTPSRNIDWSGGAVSLLTEPRPWDVNGHPRRAAVSAFGASGTNAHVVLEQAPDAPPAPADERPRTGGREVAWLLSGRTPEALRGQAARLVELCDAQPELDPAGVALALGTTRARFERRAAVVGADLAQLRAGVEAIADGTGDTATARGAGRVAFVFPGQGAQWAGMARDLLTESAVFAAAIDECEQALAPFVDWSLREVLSGSDEAWLDRVDVVQPALWAVMVSLARLWRACGVEPAVVVGHSQGEIAAAVDSGALSVADGARVVALRSRAIRAIAGRGGMVSVGLPQADVRPWLDGRSGVELAAVNGAQSVVVSGDGAALDTLQAELESAGVRHRRVGVDYASHSAHVDELEEEIVAALAPITPGPTTTAFRSTVTGEVVTGPELDAKYWFTGLRRTVDFDAVLRAVVADGCDVVVEVSPHPVLLPAVQETLDDLGSDAAALGTLRRGEGGWQRFLSAAAEVVVQGGPLDLDAVLAGTGAQAVDLPTYAFQRRRYWLDSGSATAPAPESGTDGEFWSAVERGDDAELAQLVGVAAEEWNGLLPRLAAWRERARRADELDAWRYRVTWTPLDEPRPARLDGEWVVLEPDTGHPLVEPVCAALEQAGAGVRRIAVAGTDRAALRTELADLGELSGLVSLLALDTRPLPDRSWLPRCLGTGLATVQALGDLGIDTPLWVLTSGGAGPDGTDPAQAALWALGRVAGLEHPRRWGGLLDLPPELDEAGARRLVAALAGQHGPEDQLAVRASAVFGRRLTRVAADAPAAPWTPKDCTLITGGTGGVGAQIARRLAEGGSRRLVLTGRRGPDAPGVAELVAALAGLGAEATVHALDAGDVDGLRALRALLEAEGHPICSVLHVAGAGVLESLDSVGIDDFADTAYAKIAGADAIEEALGDVEELILFSSISAVWGSGDHGAYAAANAYLDALALRRRAAGLPAVSVVWGIWDPAEGGGMAANLVEQQLRDRGIPFMDPATAMDGFEALLADARPVEVLAEIDWARFAPVFTAARPSPLLGGIPEFAAALTEAAPEAAESSLADTLAGMDADTARRTVLGIVTTEVAAVLQFADGGAVEVRRAFRELGLDSLTAIQLRNRLGAATGLTLPVTVIFDHPTAAELADHVLEQLAPAVAGDDPVRAALDALTVDQLREAGLLDPLLRLAGLARVDLADSDAEIEGMDVDSLVRMAMAGDIPADGS